MEHASARSRAQAIRGCRKLARMTAPQLLNLTDAARDFVVSARGAESDPESLALFVEVTGVAGDAFAYDMWFEKKDDAGASDVVIGHDDLSVVVSGHSADHVRGATLDFVDGGLVMINPNRPPAAAAPVPQSDLSSPLELAVLEVLEHGINPQIAAHGGRAELVSVVEGVAYLRLMGGCQGCGHAAMTLSQGIVTAIQSAVPDITDVVDVTAHAEGQNPYYAAHGH